MTDALPGRCHLPAARKLEPLEQGSIDNLCGLYAAINALRLVTPRSPRRDRTLFENGVSYLGKKDSPARNKLRDILDRELAYQRELLEEVCELPLADAAAHLCWLADLMKKRADMARPIKEILRK